MPNGPIEIIGVRERRRRWSVDDKLRLVAETHEPGASIRAVAARHDVYPNLLRAWRRQVNQGRLVAAPTSCFVPVRMVEPVPPPPIPVSPRSDIIEITLPDGAQVRVGNDVNLAALRRVVAALRG